MGRYKRLQEKYNSLEKEYIKQTADNLDLQYKYNKLKEELADAQSQRREIERLHENTRRLKHDMKNHIMVVALHLNNNEVDKAKEYLSVVLDNLNRVYSYIQTGNSVLNYIINSKLEYAQEQGVEFKAEIENLSFNKMGSVDFSALLTNALDNAIEASVNEENGFLYIGIMKKRGYDTILIKNRISKSVLGENPKLNSSKSEKEVHGYGIKQIRSIIDKYDGILDIYEKDNMFCINIMIPAE